MRRLLLTNLSMALLMQRGLPDPPFRSLRVHDSGPNVVPCTGADGPCPVCAAQARIAAESTPVLDLVRYAPSLVPRGKSSTTILLDEATRVHRSLDVLRAFEASYASPPRILPPRASRAARYEGAVIDGVLRTLARKEFLRDTLAVYAMPRQAPFSPPLPRPRYLHPALLARPVVTGWHRAT